VPIKNSEHRSGKAGLFVVNDADLQFFEYVEQDFPFFDIRRCHPDQRHFHDRVLREHARFSKFRAWIQGLETRIITFFPPLSIVITTGDPGLSLPTSKISTVCSVTVSPSTASKISPFPNCREVYAGLPMIVRITSTPLRTSPTCERQAKYIVRKLIRYQFQYEALSAVLTPYHIKTHGKSIWLLLSLFHMLLCYG
jgi:hypothetical protein